MSRIRVSEVSSPISLFPFIGILLCTMGALLVILVAVSRSAGDSAKREVIARKSAVAAGPSDEDKQKLQQMEGYVASLDTVKGAAEVKLRAEQARLSHLEDHIRRLQAQLKGLQSAAGELESLEEKHFDDREQAEREVKRLLELAADAQTTIEELKQQANTEKRSYALVPYDGPNGTHRRPIYVECVDDEIILQPEGTKISRDHLRPPYGAGNPLATALRAARDHLVRLHPNEGQSRETEPYPLLIVRPSGLLMYNRARQAIDAGDFDLGFELVENDWELKYPVPDPTLVAIEQQAIDQAVARQALLAEAAPRAYSHPGLAAAGEFEFEDEDGGSGGGGFGAGGGGSSTYLVPANGGTGGGGSAYGATDANGEEGDYDSGSADPYGTSGSQVAGGTSSGSSGVAAGGPDASNAQGSVGSGGYGVTGDGGSGTGAEAVGSVGGNVAGVGGAGGSQLAGANSQIAGGDVESSPMGRTGIAGASQADLEDSEQQPNNFSVMTGPPPDAQADPYGSKSRHDGSDGEQPDLSKSRGKDWALGRSPQRSVPVRRAIRIVVRQDQLAILNDEELATTSTPSGDVIPMKGDTVEALDSFVKQIRERISSWGIAGNGLYWRPVLVLSVGPEGQRRANDLTRLLKNSGLDVRTDATARRMDEGQHETR